MSSLDVRPRAPRPPARRGNRDPRERDHLDREHDRSGGECPLRLSRVRRGGRGQLDLAHREVARQPLSTVRSR